MDNKDKDSTEQSPKKISYTNVTITELRVRNLSQDNMRKLFNVARRVGVPVGNLVKVHIKDILAMYPPDYQNDPINED